jgi:DHA1 family bicyclomycin/chloramphenicol resistance-like MFS transporter
MIRDLYSGRAMAQIVSYAMLIFTLFPAVAPLIGAAIIAGFGWRAIFVAFLIFSVVSVGWLTLRQPETLAPEARRPLRRRPPRADIGEALAHRQMQLSILTQTLIFTALFGVLSSIQQVFDMTYGRGESFPLWFALIALLAAPSGPVNGMLVMRLGMRPMIRRRALALGRRGARHGGLSSSVGPGRGLRGLFRSGPSRSSRRPPSPSAT